MHLEDLRQFVKRNPTSIALSNTHFGSAQDVGDFSQRNSAFQSLSARPLAWTVAAAPIFQASLRICEAREGF